MVLGTGSPGTSSRRGTEEAGCQTAHGAQGTVLGNPTHLSSCQAPHRGVPSASLARAEGDESLPAPRGELPGALAHLVPIILIRKLDVDIVLGADLGNHGPLPPDNLGVILGVYTDAQLKTP